MEAIKVPGYSVLHPNQAFYKKSSIYTYENPKDMIMDVILLSKFKQPTKDEVLKGLKEYAQKVLVKKEEEYRGFDHIFASMSKERLVQYAAEDSPERDLLRNYVPVTNLIEGGYYIYIHCATVPLKELNKKERIEDEEEFDRLLRVASDEGEDQEQIQVLLENEKMPPKAKLEQILEMRVRESSAFATSFDYFDYDKAGEITMAVYDSLKANGKTGLLIDKSQSVVQETFLRTRLAQAAADMQRKNTNLMDLLARKLGAADGEPTEEDDPFELLGFDPKKFN